MTPLQPWGAERGQRSHQPRGLQECGRWDPSQTGPCLLGATTVLPQSLLGPRRPLVVWLDHAAAQSESWTERRARRVDRAQGSQGTQVGTVLSDGTPVQGQRPACPGSECWAGVLGDGGRSTPLPGTTAPKEPRRGAFKVVGPMKAPQSLANREGRRVWGTPAPYTSPRPPSCPGSLCLWPVPQRGLMLQHPGPRVLPLHLPRGFHRQELRHR